MINQIPPHLAIFPISVVKEITSLSARQIRYYEEQGLIKPERNEGKQRIFSMNDISRFLEIKSLIDQKVNIAGIKAVFASRDHLDNIVPVDKSKNTFTKITREKIVEVLNKRGHYK
ncbi:MerR family transcriptional regulator [Bacillus sp. Marseille-P3661]|uniref:MerR family transcriptional regulator n=1 Tax=Bacillus sp. Marseille-P3661 TaxID=1936234 RepID=UPI000C854B12|nr:MerR family transcriptional regulator [Bacillus sp. Marseille-P3661]